jgi:hypothetical protein
LKHTILKGINNSNNNSSRSVCSLPWLQHAKAAADMMTFKVKLTAALQLLPITLHDLDSRLDNQQYRGVSSGQAPSYHSEPKRWGPLRLCLSSYESAQALTVIAALADHRTQPLHHSSAACVRCQRQMSCHCLQQMIHLIGLYACCLSITD